MEEYYKLLDAVEQYYGAGSDQWAQIAQYGLNADNAANILRQTPGISTTVSNSGRILSYTVDNTVSLATQNAGAVINSNAQLPALSRTATVSPPANMVVDSTGKVVAESGLRTVSTGSTVAATMSKVAIGVAATSAALQLGTAIDRTLYNINPRFWDEHNMSTLNPETWDNIITNQTGKNLFNMVFGINKNNNSTQAYLDQDALAYIAAYMALQGAFDGGGVIVNYDKVQQSWLRAPKTNYTRIKPYKEMVAVSAGGDTYTYKFQSGDGYIVSLYKNNPETSIANVLFYSDSPNAVASWQLNNGQVVTHTTDLNWTYGGKTFYYTFAGYSLGYVNKITYLIGDYSTYYPNAGDYYDVGMICMFGTEETESVPGITPQDGATLPTGITPDMTPAQVLAYLQTTYPDLFNNAITNDVVQSDGSVQRYTYVPVPIPDGMTFDTVLEPIGGEHQNQQDKVVTPDVPQSVIDTLLQIITATDPVNPTEQPTEIPPEDIPPTGDGDTPVPIVPTGSAEALYSIYNPSQAELNSFGSWLWSSNFVDQLLKVFNDPMQAIIGLHKIFATPAVSGTGTIKVGYLDSGVSSNLVGNQYTTVNCGTVNLYEYFGNALDYTQTDVYLYLPFVGIVQINVDDVMRAAINVTYKVDVLTGACMCSVNVTRDLHGGQLYTYSGNCAVQYPLSSGSYMGIVSSMLSIAGSVIGTAATGGAALPLALGLGASAISSAKTRVEHSGSIGGNVGAMGIKNPYFIIRRPQTAIANNFHDYTGESVNTYTTVGSCSGFTRAKYVNLENIPGATGDELSMIENALKNGILM